MTQKFSKNYALRKCEGDTRKAVTHEEKLCDEVEAHI